MSIKTIAVFITGIIFSIVFTGCIIIPQTASIPLMTHKNEIQLDGGISVLPGITGTLTYAPTNKIALQVYGFYGADYYYYHGAMGYYWKNINDLIFEIYGGYGYGYGTGGKPPRRLRGNYNLYFTQFNFGKKSVCSPYVDYGLGIKIGLLNSKFNSELYFDFNYDTISQTAPIILYHDYSLLIEPNAFIRIGGERLKFNLKFSSCWVNKFTHTDKKGFPVGYFNIGLSINYKIN